MTQAIILAAGKGTRLLPLTEECPKTLLELKGKAILHHILDKIVENKVDKIIIVIGHYGEKIKLAVGNNYKGIPITYIENLLYKKTNSAYSLWLTKDLASNDFVVINSDTLFSKDILKYLIDSPYEITLAIDDTLRGELSDDAMKVTIINGLIKDASKKIPSAKTHGDAIGLYRFKGEGVKHLYASLRRLVENNILDQLFTKAVKDLIPHVNVYPISTRGLPWIEIDDMKDLKRAEELVNNIR